jgi:UDP-2-acetamido-3-amino-2,3-dideoxy-glucuronate N-acetyltransferase
MSTSIHPTAVVLTDGLGAGSAVHEYASLGAEVRLGADVVVGAGARLLGRVRVDLGASIGPNAVVDGSAAEKGLVVGRGAVVEAASVVDADVPAHAVVRGSPARIVSYVDALPEPTEPEIVDLSQLTAPTPTDVRGVVLHPATRARDLRGSLAAIEFDSLPFVPRRTFAVYGVPDESVRGAHAHRTCAQLLYCMSGEITCVADDGTHRQAFRLSSPEVGLYVPPLVWGMQYRYSRDAVLVVLAELPYDPDDYIRDYEEFLELVAAS